MKKKKIPWLDAFFADITSVDARAKPYVDRLKEHQDAMQAVYEEIDTKLNKLPAAEFASIGHPADTIIDTILHAAVLYDPGINKKNSQREIQEELVGVESKILEAVRHLCELLRRHNELKEKSVISKQVYLDIFHLITKAAHRDAEITPLFDRYIVPRLQGMACCDGEHYPDIIGILEGILAEFQENELAASMPENAYVSITSQKDRTPADFIRFLYSRIEMEKGLSIPKDFKLSHKAIATITESILNLPSGKTVTENTVTQAIKTLKAKTDIIEETYTP